MTPKMPQPAAAPAMPDPVRVAAPTDPDVLANARLKTADEFAKRRGRDATRLTDAAGSAQPYTRTTLG